MRQHALIKPLLSVSGMTLISRLLGFGRDLAMSGLLGAGPIMDAFVIAFRFPNMFRSLFAEGAFSAAFVPLFIALKKNDSAKKPLALFFATRVLVLLSVFLLLFITFVLIFMPEIMYFIAPGFRAHNVILNDNMPNMSTYQLAITYARICFPYLLAMAFASLFAAILQSHGLFWRGSLAASYLNICLISAALALFFGVFGNRHELNAIAIGSIFCWAVLISGIWQVVYIFFGLPKLYPHYLTSFSGWRQLWQNSIYLPMPLNYHHKTGKTITTKVTNKISPKVIATEKKLFSTMAPAMLGAGGQQLNSLVSDMIATTIGVGAVTHLFYADRLIQLPLGVIGIALSVVLLQKFSSARYTKISSNRNSNLAKTMGMGNNIAMPVQSQQKQQQKLLQQGLLVGLAFAIPSALALTSLSQDFVSFLFERGAFTAEATAKTAYALSIFAIALPFYIMNKVFQPYFYSQHDTKTPVRIVLLSFVINGLLAFLLAPKLGEGGIALASLLAAGFTSGVFIFLLIKQKVLLLTWDFLKPFIELLAGNLLAALVFFGLNYYFHHQLQNFHQASIPVLIALGFALLYYPIFFRQLYRRYFHN